MGIKGNTNLPLSLILHHQQPMVMRNFSYHINRSAGLNRFARWGGGRGGGGKAAAYPLAQHVRQARRIS